jgi:hypothetical protein
MKETKFASSPNMHIIECGLVLYLGKKPGNDLPSFKIKQTIDINNPNFFEELCDQPLEKLTPNLPQNLSLDFLPCETQDKLSLLHGNSQLIDLDSLVFVVVSLSDAKSQNSSSYTKCKDKCRGVHMKSGDFWVIK